MKNVIGLMAITVFVLSSLALPAAPPEAAKQAPDLQKLASDPKLFLETASKLLKWEEPAEPAKLIGPIYFVGTKGLSVFLITTSAGHIVVNTGMPSSGPMIEKSIRKLGFKPEEIKYLLTGHAHVDHAGGHAYLKKISNAKVAMLREEQALYESGGKLDFHYGNFSEFAFEPTKVDLVLDDGDTFKLGDVAITTLLTSGHTRGSMSFVMKIVEDGKELTVLFPNGTSINPGYRVSKDPSYPGIADDYRRTHRVLESLKPDIWLNPHNDTWGYETKLARSAKEGSKAWIDPEGYAKWVAGERQKFEAVVAKEQQGSDK